MIYSIHSLQTKHRALHRKFPLESRQARGIGEIGKVKPLLFSTDKQQVLPRLSLTVLGVLTYSVYMGNTVCVPLIFFVTYKTKDRTLCVEFIM